MLTDLSIVWTDGEIQRSNFQLSPSLDVSQLLSYAACMARVNSHSENEMAAYFDIYNMYELGMFHGLPSNIKNTSLLEIMTGRKRTAVMATMVSERKKENEERNEEDPPRPPLPKIKTRGTYTEKPNPDQAQLAQLLNLGKLLDLVAKEATVKTYDSESKSRERSAEAIAAHKQTTDQNKKDRDDKLEKVLPEVLQVLDITSELRGLASAADCTQAMVTLAGLFELSDIHEGLNG